MAAVCGAVQQDQNSFERARMGFPTADWYSIDSIWTYGERDIIKRRANIDHNRVRFSCNNGVAAIYNPSQSQSAQQSSTSPQDAAPPPPPTLNTDGKPDLYISEFKMTPSTPVKGQPVNIRVGVYNKGTARSGPFTVKWWPGENYNQPGCSWNLSKMNARGGRILNCTYSGYPSRYGRINTKVAADTNNQVAESNEANNVLRKRISVNSSAASTDGASPSSTGSTGGSDDRKPDLYISEFKMTPSTPVKGQPVNIRIGVYNKGTAQSGPFTVKWWPGENYTQHGCSWNLTKMNARGGRILNCTYQGYPSWYGRLNTKVVADTNNTVQESNEGNNVFKKRISVSR
jgi:hypothetical protein